jgi:hypothetical protein
MTLGLVVRLEEREGAERGALTGSPGGKDECLEGRGKHRTNHPTRGSLYDRCGAEKAAGGEAGKEKKEINHERSQYLYENKQNNDKLPRKKATFLYNGATFCTKARVFC